MRRCASNQRARIKTREVLYRRKPLGSLLTLIASGDVPTGAGDNINEISGNGQDEEMRLQPEATGKNS